MQDNCSKLVLNMLRERKYLILLCIVVFILCYMYVLVTHDSSLVTSRGVILTRPSLTEGVAEGPRNGYVLVKRYSGQQGAGIKAVCSLQRWIRDLNLPMMVVEPFLLYSVVGVHRLRNGQKEGIRFSDMFDINSFNAASRKEGLPEMIPWTDYYNNAPKNAVYINMKPITRNNTFTPPSIKETSTVIDITSPDNTSIYYCQLRNVQFHWKYANAHTLSSDDIYGNVLRGLDLTNITLIFSLWRGPWSIDKLTTAPQSSNDYLDNQKFRDSPKLQYSMRTYQKKFLTSHGASDSRYVAVMIRAEHSVLQFQSLWSTNISDDINKCLNQLQIKTNEAMKEIGTNELLVTSDVGYYGSSSWNDTMSSPSKGNKTDVLNRVKRSVERLYEGRKEWTFEDWEHSFNEASDGIVDRGYIAALQRVLATSSNAACLILMGGGLFQELSLENYLQHTSHQTHSRCIHMVCMQRKYYQSFNSMLTKAGE